MARIFAYIVHRGGVVEDSAAELLAAARKIDAIGIAHRDSHWLGRGTRCSVRFSPLFFF